MTVKDALKEFFNKLNGATPSGNNVADVIRNGASSVQQNNESALTTRVVAVETAVAAVETAVAGLANSVPYEDDGKSIILDSSTAESTKKFKITVVDAGTITATEVVEPEPDSNP